MVRIVTHEDAQTPFVLRRVRGADRCLIQGVLVAVEDIDVHQGVVPSRICCLRYDNGAGCVGAPCEEGKYIGGDRQLQGGFGVVWVSANVATVALVPCNGPEATAFDRSYVCS